MRSSRKGKARKQEIPPEVEARALRAQQRLRDAGVITGNFGPPSIFNRRTEEESD